MTNTKNLLSITCAGLLCLLMITGCEHGTQGSGFSYGDTSVPSSDEDTDDTDDTATVNNFVGTWKLTSTSDGASWYGLFYDSGSWKICDSADGSGQRVYGTYSVSGANLNGNMTNPGVGTGAISATITDGVMALNFVEYWHSPNKTVRYTGSKL